MKKLLLFFIALSLSWGLRAQCPLTQAVDFTATDIHGTEVHLFDILDGGQAVLIDFFFTTCGPCQQAVPKVVESYTAMGCNMHDVFYIEIATGDSDAACLNWVNNYNVEYPTISGTGGGTTICSQYGIQAYPTVILIMPNHQIVIQDLYPIPSAQTIITALEGHGLQQHDCSSPTYDPQVTITINEVTENTASVSFSPNEDCAAYYYNLLTEAEMQSWMNYYGITSGEVLQQYGFSETEAATHDFQGLDPQEAYFVWAVPADVNGVLYEVQQVPLIETPLPQDTMPDFIANDIDGNELHLYDILDSGQTVLINFFLKDDNSETIMPFVTESYRLFGCNQNDVFFMEICPQDEDDACRAWADSFGVSYPTISRTGGGNDIAQSIPVAYYPTVLIVKPDHTYAYRDLYPIENTQTIVNALEGLGCEQHECETAIGENDIVTIELFPNPANESLTLKGQNIQTVEVYNTIGQKIHEWTGNSSEVRIATTSFESGVYFVKVNGELTQQFIVTH